MGYSLIEVRASGIALLEMEALKLSGRKDNYERLSMIHEKVESLIRGFRPHEFAIEAPFFGKNVQSMLKLGRAQGVAIAAAMRAGLPVTEYSPRRIKQAVTGNGNADKQQVWKMLQQLLSLTEAPRYFDATDALAVAVCHHYELRSVIPAATKKTKAAKVSSADWEAFIKKNPGRVL